MQQIIMGINKFKVILFYPSYAGPTGLSQELLGKFSPAYTVFEIGSHLCLNGFCTDSTAVSSSSADYSERPSALWLSHGQTRKTSQQEC